MADLFEFKGNVYLCVQDYFSKYEYIEMLSLDKIITEDIKMIYMEK